MSDLGNAGFPSQFYYIWLPITLSELFSYPLFGCFDYFSFIHSLNPLSKYMYIKLKSSVWVFWCLFVCTIIIQKPLEKFASQLHLVAPREIVWVDFIEKVQFTGKAGFQTITNLPPPLSPSINPPIYLASIHTSPPTPLCVASHRYIYPL